MRFLEKVILALFFVVLGYLFCYFDWLTTIINFFQGLFA